MFLLGTFMFFSLMTNYNKYLFLIPGNTLLFLFFFFNYYYIFCKNCLVHASFKKNNWILCSSSAKEKKQVSALE